MEFSDKEIKRMLIIFVIFVLGVLVFFLVKPVAMSILGGLVLAYIFFPLYRITSKYLKSKNLSATIVSLIAMAVIIVPLWFIVPIMIQQLFELFRFSQTVDVQGFLEFIFSSAPEEFITQASLTLNTLVSKITSGVLNSLVNLFLNASTLLMNILIAAFVFFFALRDSDKLKEFVSEISPFNKTQEKVLIGKFRNTTYSIVYGQIIVGLAQGVVAGLALLIFGIPNALLLGALAIVLSIIPILGPALIWIPATIYLFATGSALTAAIFFLFNLIVVSSLDNVLRSYIVARSSELSTAIILIGMIGGLFVFGLLGLILGPLILEYFLTFLRAYKEKTLVSLFRDT